MNNTTMYVINAVLVLMVVRQIREHPLDLRSLAGPVLAVGAAAVLFLHSVPGGGNDIALELACVAAGPGRHPARQDWSACRSSPSAPAIRRSRVSAVLAEVTPST